MKVIIQRKSETFYYSFLEGDGVKWGQLPNGVMFNWNRTHPMIEELLGLD